MAYLNVYDRKISLESLVEKNNLVVFDLENPSFSLNVFHMDNTWFIQFNEYHVYSQVYTHCKCFEEAVQITILSELSYFTIIKFRILFSKRSW